GLRYTDAGVEIEIVPLKKRRQDNGDLYSFKVSVDGGHQELSVLFSGERAKIISAGTTSVYLEEGVQEEGEAKHGSTEFE
ncbi:MAG: hypothetical protein KF861_16845, partial [Planctomycetaceae bacterium]|nr:hypothetical protein [Planctomycetaceae bacterium]